MSASLPQLHCSGELVGALVGVVADVLDLRAAVTVVAVLSVISGLVVAGRMREGAGVER